MFSSNGTHCFVILSLFSQPSPTVTISKKLKRTAITLSEPLIYLNLLLPSYSHLNTPFNLFYSLQTLFLNPPPPTMAGDGIRVISTTNKTDSCKGKKRALTSQTQDGIVSSTVRISKEKEVKTSGIGNSDHEEHIQTERDRRKRMRDLFSCLQAFHSHLPPKASTDHNI